MDVGDRLKRARVEQGLYVPELTYRTHIRASLIEDIERNDFSNCGGDVYARGHVRALATALGLDPLPLLQDMGIDEHAALGEISEPTDRDSLSIWELDKRSWSPSGGRARWLLSVLAIVMVGVLIWQARARETAVVLDNAVDVTSPSASASATPSAAASGNASPTETATATTPAGALALQVHCSATSWVRVRNTTGTLFEGNMYRGETKVFSSQTDVTLRIGNAAGVSLVVDGVPYANLGASGQVYDHTFAVG